MEITEVRIKLMGNSDDRLQAFCSITFDDCFVIRDLKIIDGTNGPFVAMPSRKLTSHCPACGCKNHLRAAHCNQCGARLKDDRVARDPEGRTKLYADIAHPINSDCREMIQNRVIAEFRVELERARQPGYVSRYDEEDFDVDFVDEPVEIEGRGGQRTEVQPAETEPRGPHKAPTQQKKPPSQQTTPHSRPQTSETQKDSPDNFGAGIF